jgi:pimeloyl-ACP methyl ester carboxylesterase
MTSDRSGCRIIRRGYAKALFLIPGWACDCRVFERLDLPFDFILSDNIQAEDYPARFLLALQEYGFDKASILGWSMGGFIAQDIFLRYPEKVSEIFLVSVRKEYESGGIEKIKSMVRQNKRAFLYKFYQDLFADSEKEEWGWFRKNLLKEYTDGMDEDFLIRGLEYLCRASMRPESLRVPGLRIIHGTMDKIAPIEEARSLKYEAERVAFISIDGAGHMPFMRAGFRDLFVERR